MSYYEGKAAVLVAKIVSLLESITDKGIMRGTREEKKIVLSEEGKQGRKK